MSDFTLIDHSREAKQELEAKLERGMTAVGLQAEANAKLELENDPRRIDTGRLRNSIANQYVPSEKAVYIGTNVEYALPVHEGTSRMRPNRFLKNACVNNANDYKAILETYMK